MRAIAGNKWGASKAVLLLIYRSLIRSILDYGTIVYDSMSDTIISKNWTLSNPRLCVSRAAQHAVIRQP